VFQGIGFYRRNSDGESTGSFDPSKYNLTREGGGLGLGDSVAAVAHFGAFRHMLGWLGLHNISVHCTFLLEAPYVHDTSPCGWRAHSLFKGHFAN
jgi:hypothetical protein